MPLSRDIFTMPKEPRATPGVLGPAQLREASLDALLALVGQHRSPPPLMLELASRLRNAHMMLAEVRKELAALKGDMFPEVE